MAGLKLDVESKKKTEKFFDNMDGDETVEYVNYWIEFQKRLPDVLRNLQGLVLIVYTGLEFTDIVEILNKIEPDRFVNVLYVSLVRSYKYIRQVLEYKPCGSKRFFVVDCVSGYAFPTEEDVDECFYHKPPSSLEEMKKIIEFGVEKCSPEMVVIDSLSQFINFSHLADDELNELYSFFKTLRKKVSTNGQEVVVLLYDSEIGGLHRLPKDVVDEVIKVEKIKEISRKPLMINWFQNLPSPQPFDYHLKID
ncbi:MAG TPA: hypothetical protein ENI42_02955 [Thermoplasmatales archaeon]|nr:hypothetical protein [Thermoplasmatales archaeon]